ncbi:AAA family ATPase [Streptomyces sp. MMBL 11-3]|uniref:AAA family ATPase n=1 Tax=Streptomyces sp. MMBL 11-3 TaxID=3382639 RepID=UPI0039B5313F
MTVPPGSPSLHGGVAVGPDHADTRPVGRERESDEAHRRLSDPDGPRLVLVRGERGVGRTAFAHAVAERLRAAGATVLALDCVPGDDTRPLLLALRLVMALTERRPTRDHWPATEHRRQARTVTEAVRAAELHDGAAMAGLLRAALAQAGGAGPVVMMLDDLQHADAESLAVLQETDFPRLPPGISLLATAVGRSSGPGLRDAHTIVLPALGPDATTAMVARRLRATPDTGLARRVRELTLGVPGAVDALLTGWTRDGAVRVADGHAFVGARTPAPVLPDDDRFVTALEALGEPCRRVAGALSILWPLGGRTAELIAAATGLSAGAVGDGLRDLVAAEIVEHLPGPAPTPDGPAPDGPGPAGPGGRIRLPLVAHALRERLGPLERGRLSATAAEALWAARDAAGGTYGEGPPVVDLLDEPDAVAHLADRVAEAGSLVDRDRAVDELTAAARRLHPDPEGRGVLRWCRAVCHLVERPADRVTALHRYAKAAYNAGDHRTARTIAESVLRDLADVLDPSSLQDVAVLFTAATADDLDRRALSRLTTERWWAQLPLPDLVAVTGRALALGRLERWHEALDLLSRTEPVWGAEARTRAKPAYFRAVAELALGRPERFRAALALPEAPYLDPGHVHALATTMVDELLSGRDLRAAEALLAERGLTADVLAPHSLFLWHHLRGRWDEALEPARWMLANDRTATPTAAAHLVPARTAAVLLARGRPTSARRLLDAARGRPGGPLEYALDAVEADVLRALGDPAGAAGALRRGLDAADARGHVAGTGELWASLAEVHAEEGRPGEAAACLGRLERLAGLPDGDRTRLTYLLASARVLRPDDPATAHRRLREAVELARARRQPFETAVTLVAAAGAGAGPPGLLHEAYELFGTAGAALSRFRTRAAMREAGTAVPGRRQATVENERLLATLIAEGLTNRQVAAVLRLSEDAVANRLTRLFTRTGLRSRTEVVTAVLTPHHPVGLRDGPDGS